MQPKVFEIDPCPKPRQSAQDRWKVGANARPAVARYRAFCDNLRLQAGSWRLPDSFAVTFTLAMPKSWSKKKRAELDGQPAQQKPDLSNLVKSLEDAMRDDDEKVHQVAAKKVWGPVGKIVVFEITNVLFQMPMEKQNADVMVTAPHQTVVPTPTPVVVPSQGRIQVQNPLDVSAITKTRDRLEPVAKADKTVSKRRRAKANQKIS